MKKLFCLLLCLLMLPCALAEEKTLADHGMDVIALLVQKASSPAWLQAYTQAPEIISLAEEVCAGDYSQPVHIYALTVDFSQSDLDMFLSAEGLSEPLKTEFLRSLPGMVPTLLNGQQGSAALATASMLTTSKLFVYPELTEGVIYLYDFGARDPMMVSFTVGEDGAVQASANVLFCLYSNALDLSALADIDSLTTDMGITLRVEIIQ